MGVLLGKAERVRVTAPIETSAEPPKVSTEAAFEHRAELKVVEAQQAAGESMRKSANSRFLPQLSATGSIFASDEPYPTGDKTGWRVAVELTIPLYDGGFRYGKRREADAAIALANTQAAQKRLQIRQEIADAEREIRVADERLRLAETRAQLARDAAASAQRSFTVGLTSSLDVLDANDKLFQAEVALAAERAKKAQARIELARARGTL
jgi:outer membrane protein TolC